MTKVLVLYYSSYGHIETMAEAVAEGAGRVGDHDVCLAPVVAGRQQPGTRLPAVAQRRGDLRQRVSGVEHLGTHQMGGQVAVAQHEPVADKLAETLGIHPFIDYPGAPGVIQDAGQQGVHLVAVIVAVFIQ